MELPTDVQRIGAAASPPGPLSWPHKPRARTRRGGVIVHARLQAPGRPERRSSVVGRPSSVLTALLVLTVILTACAPSTPAPTATASVPPTASPVPPTPTLSGPVYDNPVYEQDFPDPFIMVVDGTYYAFATTGASANIQLIRSTDLENWERLGDAVPGLPLWASPNSGLTWAPTAMPIGGRYVLYYTARDKASDRQCISQAVSDVPEGPYVDTTSAATVCQVDLGGSIDPYLFQDADGQLYLFWKNDGNCCGKTVGLWVQPLSDDGLALEGEPVELLQRDQAWERPLIENPAMVLHDGQYYLFYSGNWWESVDYAVGYGVCETVTGPCTKPKTKPIYTYAPEALGPGGEAFFTDPDGNLWMVYHAWSNATVGYPGGKRALYIDPVTFANGEPVITGPTSDPQPMP
jgi:beta-xylosidase